MTVSNNVARFPDLAGVRSMLADRQPVPIVRRKDSPPPHIPREGQEAGIRSAANDKGWLPDAIGLPKLCPVHPLGISGSVGYFLDPIGQVQSLAPPYGKGHILGLFGGDDNFLAWAWPRHGSKGIDGFAAEKAAAALIMACNAKGPWDSVEKVRGRGCWRARDGSIVLHRGTKVHISGRDHPPGDIEGFIYPTRPRLESPWPAEIGINPATALRPLLKTWNWSRPEVDPQLLLGWYVAAMIGGALDWRPTVYLTGDAATGKSTLQELGKGLVGEYMIQSTDTTSAGLYQHLGTDALAISVDEFEGKSDTRAAEKVLELARQSCSGGLMLRGGDRHNPVEFRARSCFMFSSINTPPLRPQDLSRMAVLRLQPLPKMAPEQVAELRAALDPHVLKNIGRMMLRRALDEWQRFPATLLAYKGALAAAGMDSRGQDTFGTLLACADLVEFEGWDEARLLTVVDGEDELVAWADLMRVDRMAEFEDRAANWRKCLSHLLGVRVDAWRTGGGKISTVGQLLQSLWDSRDVDVLTARAQLGNAGLGIVARMGNCREGLWLAVPNQSPLVRELFNGSDWGGAIGASVWAGALRQSPEWVAGKTFAEGGGLHQAGKQRVNGDVVPCTMISLAALYGEGGLMAKTQEELNEKLV